MKRTLFIAGLCIAVLLGGSLIFVALFTGRHPPASPEATATATAAPPSSVAPPATASPSLPAAPKPAPPRVAWDAAPRDPSAPPMASRVTRKVVRKALQAAPIQSRLARCVDRDVGFGGGAGRPPRPAPAVLTLEMETLDGQVRILEVNVRTWGGANQETVSCAQSALRGKVLAARGVRPGERMQMPFPLNPRSGALAAKR
jgi:hypothetical protein